MNVLDEEIQLQDTVGWRSENASDKEKVFEFDEFDGEANTNWMNALDKGKVFEFDE